jgi:N-methylhydantoinase A
MLSADVVEDVSRTLMVVLDELDLDDLERTFAELAVEATASLADQGVPRSRAFLERVLELRYLGQEHSLALSVPSTLDGDAIRAAFQEEHRARYGHAMDNRLQVLNVRTRGVGRTEPIELPVLPAGDGDPAQARSGEREAFDFGARTLATFSVFERALLEPGDRFSGPALIDEGTSTTVVHSGQHVEVDQYGHVLITAGGAS